MNPHYYKRWHCLSCGKYVDGFQSDHMAQGHRVSEYVVGGYRNVEERREPLIEIKPEKEKIKMDWLQQWEGNEEPEEIEGI